ncbi:P-loop containing nucleoside triphosphate hydrolase protein [Halteromyces radiatus]|uniref:P-loop containing nucleoside triphosphate hydrolase protein n=1 Tax=Halteromyces radiatus TaxID=101107 RepID=UPI0022200D6C|nr:P-loop containing nucleoside triphosphate hydrolase protein [Halteromyces radiatus]KAI8086257.1 P-loop containing nucleoside triphosphate hydrolase protein [Halteromyces radiatus]
MDDDGMMLNFAPVRSQPNNNRSQPTHRSGKTGSTNSSFSTTEEARSKKTTPTTNSNSKIADDSTTATSVKLVHGKAQIQSSLFTSNPTVKVERMSTSEKMDQQPSNAPSADETNTLASLGLCSELIQALEKMNVYQPTLVQRRAIPLLLGPAQHQQTAYDLNNSSNKRKADVDIVVQAQTGSGKTLTYLLPIVQRLVAASTYDTNKSSAKAAFGDRTIGTVGIILTPTRELAQQVTTVLRQLLQLPRIPADADYGRRHWMVADMVMGGGNKSKEKARLRKGVTLLVSTPGRLLDHLQNTKSFDIRHLKWLVLDEADRLLDLGFEETLKNIMDLIKQRTEQPPQPAFRQYLQSVVWPRSRQTILCSATLRDDVKHLAGTALVDPIFVRGSDQENDSSIVQEKLNADHHIDKDEDDMKFSTPNQLKQTYTISPAKLRLVTLTAMLQQCMKDKRKPSKVIVFFSCCDSVDFHYDLFAKAGTIKSDVDEDKDDLMEILDNHDDDDDDDDDDTKRNKNNYHQQQKNKKTRKERQQEQDEFRRQPSQPSTLLGGDGNEVSIYRLHGDLEQHIRSLTFSTFSEATSGILLCTDVAARGLDLPNVDRIIQYDPPTDMKDYVHRVGRTARLGKAGEARLFLLPSEMDYLPILKAQGMTIQPVTVENVLAQSFGKQQHVYETKAQEYQNQLERYVLSEEEHVLLARKAFWSSVRAYATHAASEKHVFHVKKLHLGHLAKSFALREAPSHLQDPSKIQKKKDAKQERMPGKQKLLDKDNKSKGSHQNNNIPQKKRKQYDQADEFAIANSDYLSGGPTTKKKKKIMTTKQNK